MNKINQSYINLKDEESIVVDILNSFDFVKKGEDEYYYAFETEGGTSVLKLNHQQCRKLLMKILEYRDCIDKQETTFILHKKANYYEIEKCLGSKRDLIREECLVSVFENIFKEKRIAS